MTSPIAASNSVNIFPPESKPYGLTYTEHAEDFWKWALKIPASENPVNDQTEEKCTNGQLNTNSSVFYLPTQTNMIDDNMRASSSMVRFYNQHHNFYLHNACLARRRMMKLALL